MMDQATKSGLQRAGRRRRDWVPMGLALCVWACTLPFVFLLTAPWFGARVAVVTAVALLAVIGAVCWALCAGSRATCDPPTRSAEPGRQR